MKKYTNLNYKCIIFITDIYYSINLQFKFIYFLNASSAIRLESKYTYTMNIWNECNLFSKWESV